MTNVGGIYCGFFCYVVERLDVCDARFESLKVQNA